MKRKYLPLIAARGGSKGIPNKNIALLNGKPLILYSIDAWKKTGLLGPIYVSTDNSHISKIVKEAGATVINSPTELATDNSKLEFTVKHALDKLMLKSNFDYTHFVLLQPTSPLRTEVDILNAISLTEKSELDATIVSVCETNCHPFKQLRVNQDGTLETIFEERALSMPRQELPAFVRQNGAIYICPIDKFLKKLMFCMSPLVPYQMEEQYSVDIDTPLDLAFAELILKDALDAV